jgi:F420-non-reducing hydrogenase iron-sulfur subunit
MENFEPVIVAFVCNWCTYTAADLAGTSRLSYPKNVRLIRVMCTGMVDPKYVIKALLEGADGVLVSGCHPGDCHYINGNYKARRRIKTAQGNPAPVRFRARAAATDLDRRQ